MDKHAILWYNYNTKQKEGDTMIKADGTEVITICDVLKYKKDIEPFPLVKIYSGVGSGKSFFATTMIKGSKEYEIPKHNVLIITSRRSKVEETLKEMGVLVSDEITKNGNLNFDVWQTGEEQPLEYEDFLRRIKINTDWGEVSYSMYNKSVVCTNAFVYAYLHYVHNPSDPITHIWNKFDAIIVDEVHSLITDATYQPAAHAVLSLIKEYLKLYKNKQLQECACKHLILMTGTPQPFEELVELDFPKECTNELYLFEECENVTPKNVIIIDQLTANTKIKELLLSGEKVIYFTNHTLTRLKAKEQFNLPETVSIGVSFSNEDKRKKLSQDEKTEIERIDDSLSQNSLIPNDIQLFVTTSRNKEGINIHNKDIHNMFVETHLMYDAVQMAGRVREGIDNLYIISNADQFKYDNTLTDILFSKKVMVANTDYESSDESNKYLASEYFDIADEKEWTNEETLTYTRRYIEYIESRFAYVRFNVFQQVFEFYYQREKAQELNKTQNTAFNEMLLSDNNQFVENWFPHSSVQREISAKERATNYLFNVIGKEPFIRLSKENFNKHLSVITELFNSPYKAPIYILHLVDENFNYIDSGGKYLLYYGTQDPRIKKTSMRKRKMRKS